jgi:hypothetical protein
MTEILESLNIYNIINWLTDMPWYWQIIIASLGLHYIFMTGANKIYNEAMTQKDEEIRRLKNKIIITELDAGIRSALPDDFIFGPGEFVAVPDECIPVPAEKKLENKEDKNE